jgi:hypothetical protein
LFSEPLRLCSEKKATGFRLQATALVLVLVLVLGFSSFRVSRGLMFDCGNPFLPMPASTLAALLDVQLQLAELLLVPADKLAERYGETLDRVVVHHYPLVDLEEDLRAGLRLAGSAGRRG